MIHCANCKYSQKPEPNPNTPLNSPLLECWYNPPQTLILPNGSMALAYQTVRASDKCSKYLEKFQDYTN